MKILVDARKLSNKPSGVGYYIYNFISALINSNIDFILLTDVIESEEIKDLVARGIKFISYNKSIDKSYDVISYFKFVQKEILLNKPDIFWEPNNIIPFKIINPYGKVVVTIHDIFPITDHKHYSLMYRYYFSRSLRNVINNSDALIFVSNETKKEVENFSKKVLNLKSFISYNIVVKKELKEVLIKDKNYFLFIGNIEKRKGIDILLQAFKKYKLDGGFKTLVIAGSLRDKRILKDIKKVNFKINENIVYYGYITNEKKQELLSECSCFVFPSRAEGFGIPTIEAMYYNKPIILSNLEIFKEIVTDSVNYFDLSNKKKSITNLYNSMKSYEVNTSSYEKILDKYSYSTRSKELNNFFDNLVEGGV